MASMQWKILRFASAYAGPKIPAVRVAESTSFLRLFSLQSVPPPPVLVSLEIVKSRSKLKLQAVTEQQAASSNELESAATEEAAKPDLPTNESSELLLKIRHTVSEIAEYGSVL